VLSHGMLAGRGDLSIEHAIWWGARYEHPPHRQ
jgi:hypothetical protein